MITAKDFSQFTASRRTTRDFQATQVADEIIDEILTDALTAPSWSNTRPFLVAAATGEKRDRISAEFCNRWDAVVDARNGSMLAKIKLLITRYGLPTSNKVVPKPYPKELRGRSAKVGKDLYTLLGVDRKDKVARDLHWRRNYEFFGAPTVLFVFAHKHFGLFSASDAGMLTQNIVLSAHAHGLGSCAQGAYSIWEDAIRAEFDIPEQYGYLYGIALGYPSDSKANSFQAERIDVSEIKIS